MAESIIPDNEYRTHLEEMAAAYALGTLDDPQDRTYFEDLIAAKDPVALALLQEMFEATMIFAKAAPQLDPPQEVEEALLKKVLHVPKDPVTVTAPEPQHKPTNVADKEPVKSEAKAYVPVKVKPYLITFGAFLLVFMVILTVRILNLQGPDKETVTQLEQTTKERDSLTRILSVSQHTDSLRREALTMLQDPAGRLVTLTGHRTTVQLIWSPTRNAVVLLAPQLPKLASNDAYHLWQFEDTKKHSIGWIRPDSIAPPPLYQFKSASSKADAFRVTIEQDSAVATPGPMVVAQGAVPRDGYH